MPGSRNRSCKRTGLVAGLAAALAACPALGVDAATVEAVLPPQPRPAATAALPMPDARPPAAPPRAQSKPANSGGAGGTCLAQLRSLGVKFSLAAPISASSGCRVPAPVAVAEIAPGLRLKPESRLNCQTVQALANWARNVVLPAARIELDARPTALVHDSTYVCRRRNNRPDSKLSEHATGNAIDIRAIEFSGRDAFPIRIWNGRAGPRKRFQARLRKGACEQFTTVLGPGTNAAHATHFHFDLARRKNGYRLCE